MPVSSLFPYEVVSKQRNKQKIGTHVNKISAQ